ncbi:hypothetical protein [Bdellovibrio svalbardensis]|uniref:DUF4013 domain-containing protein n=1 Tax=Bdellovibrio svalbardensis TaxID=2972972 RepID=A0ABT6DD00_9BACT|nr:hypothetical protein [Bdellovibrio svalbardensis]MDG0814739.1 hypothetical protein [Bdellovibrio svalbardensis]
MNPVKQALIAFKTNWKESLYLGAAATVFIFFSQVVPFIGAFLISLGLLIFQELTNIRLRTGQWKLDLSHFQNDWMSLIITAIILMPTGILLGSAFGLLQSPQEHWRTFPMSLGLFILGIYFFMILSHGFNLQQKLHGGIAKALDATALASIKNFKLYLVASFYTSVALMIGGLLKGVGFVLALPFLFYVGYFVFADMVNKDAFKKGS